jgi:precorrin-6B methylase 2
MEPRQIEFDNNKTLEIIQDLKFGYAGEVWDSALVFCNSTKKENFQKMFDFKNKVILELGSGTGICGLFLSAFEPKKIILTDKKEALELISKNFKLNTNFICKNTEIIIEEFNWNDNEKLKFYKENYKFDYIFCSDIIYDKNQYENLQKIFNELVVEKQTTALMVFNYREETGIEFFDYFKQNNSIWEFKKLGNEFIHEDYICDDILMIYARKK